MAKSRSGILHLCGIRPLRPRREAQLVLVHKSHPLAAINPQHHPTNNSVRPTVTRPTHARLSHPPKNPRKIFAARKSLSILIPRVPILADTPISWRTCFTILPAVTGRRFLNRIPAPRVRPLFLRMTYYVLRSPACYTMQHQCNQMQPQCNQMQHRCNQMQHFATSMQHPKTVPKRP